MTREKFNQLRSRVIRHTVVADTAVVVVTAKELEELLDMAEPNLPKERCPPGECVPPLNDCEGDYSTCIHCGCSIDLRG